MNLNDQSMSGPDRQSELLKVSSDILQWFEKNNNPNEYLISWYKEGLESILTDQTSEIDDNEWVRECISANTEKGVELNKEIYTRILTVDIPEKARAFLEVDLGVLAQTSLDRYYGSKGEICPFSYAQKLFIQDNVSSGFRQIYSEEVLNTLLSGYIKLLTNLFQAKINALIEPITFVGREGEA